MDVALAQTLPVVAGQDRRCRGWTLDNRIRRWWAPAQAEADLLSVQSGQQLADLGVGVGYLTASLLGRVGPSGAVFAVDPDEQILEVVRARFGHDPRVRILRASAAHVPDIADQSVDRAILFLVLCCMVDKVGALDESWRILRPGGLVLVSYPERRWRLNRRKASLRVRPEDWEHLVGRHPWTVLTSSRQGLVRRHLLKKSGAAVRAGSGAT